MSQLLQLLLFVAKEQSISEYENIQTNTIE